MQNILVSIICNAYNHEAYIADAIEGFVMQQTNFGFEILLHDDSSTDNTPGIIKKYEEKYPGLVKPIYQKENQYSQGREIIHSIQRKRAKGKYFAICEGDDYWIDKYKLQRQLDFMETNPQCSLCFHPSRNIDATNPANTSVNQPVQLPGNSFYGMKHVIKYGGNFMATCSMFYKKDDIMPRPGWFKTAPIGDLPTMLLLASKGSIGYIDEVMSIYRVMTPNSWTSKIQTPRKQKKHFYAMLKMWDNFDQWSGKKYHWLVVKRKWKKRRLYYKGVLLRYLLNIYKKFHIF